MPRNTNNFLEPPKSGVWAGLRLSRWVDLDRRFADGVCSLGLFLFGACGAKNNAHNMIVCSTPGEIST